MSYEKNDVQTPPVVVVGTVVGQPIQQPQVVHATINPQVAVVVTGSPQPTSDAPSLLPFPNEHNFHHGVFDRICDCGGEWWLTTCCPCVSLAHISSRLRAIDPAVQVSSFNCILWTGVILFIIDRILNSVGGGTNLLNLWVFIIACQLRGVTRHVLQMPQDAFGDCCCTFWCSCCAIQQMVGSLFPNPHEKPGCSWVDEAHTV